MKERENYLHWYHETDSNKGILFALHKEKTHHGQISLKDNNSTILHIILIMSDDYVMYLNHVTDVRGKIQPM